MLLGLFFSTKIDFAFGKTIQSQASLSRIGWEYQLEIKGEFKA